MNKTQRIAFGAVAVLAVAVLVLALRNPSPPGIPGDRDHTWNNADGCLVCHGPAGRSPRTPNHPVGRDCLQCHAWLK